MMIETKETVGRYELLAKIGRAAEGVMYQGYDPESDRMVAIKTITLADDSDSVRANFFFDIRAAKRLSHPAIAVVYDAGYVAATQTLYVVSEYVPGHSLGRLLDPGLPLTTSLTLAKEIAEALAYAHREGVIHRGLNPSNILVTEDGHAKIADFGLANLQLASSMVHREALQSIAYLAPEQLAGENIDSRCDLFSLGIVLREMLTAARALENDGANAVNSTSPTAAADLSPSQKLDRLVSRATAPDPVHRYQNGRELAYELQQILNQLEFEASGSPTPALPELADEPPPSFTPPATPADQSPLPARSGSWLLPLTIAAVVLIAVVLGILTYPRKHSAIASQPSNPSFFRADPNRKKPSAIQPGRNGGAKLQRASSIIASQ